MEIESVVRRTVRGGLVGLVLALSACAGKGTLTASMPLDVDEAGHPAGVAGSTAPGKDDEDRVEDALDGLPTHCAAIYPEVAFTGEHEKIPDGASAVELDGPGAVIVAPGCTLTLEAARVEAGYVPDGSTLSGRASCACIGPAPALAYLIDVDTGTGSLPLYAGEPVDLEPLGWSARAGGIVFVTRAAVATVVSDAAETTVAGDRVRPAAIVRPESDRDGNGLVDLRWELFHSLPARGPDNMLPLRLDVIEVNATDARPVGYVDCEAHECRDTPGEAPP